MVRPERIELPTSWFVAMRSIQLSYGRNFDGLRLGIIAETKTVRRKLAAPAEATSFFLSPSIVVHLRVSIPQNFP